VSNAAVFVLLTLFAIGSVAMLSYLIRAAASGRIRARGKRYVRSRQPWQFWTTVGAGFLCTGAVSIIIAWQGLHWLFPGHVPAVAAR